MKNANPAIHSPAPNFTIERTSRFTPQEEKANAISHLMGALLSIYGLILLLFYSIRMGDASAIIGASIFGVSLLTLYTSSTLNHVLPTGRAKNVFHNIDQIAVYFLIAGTYTPFALMIKDDWGLLLLSIEWLIAISGMIMKLLLPNAFERGVNVLSILSYVIMGWLLVFFLAPLYRHIDPMGVNLIFLGGAFYTFGIMFFKAKNIRQSHLIWHLMVMAGSAVHWWAIMKYVIMA